MTEETPGGEDVLTWDDTVSGEPAVGDRLSTGQREELQQVIQDYPDVFSTRPGLTTLAEYKIETSQAKPVLQSPYRLPHEYRDMMKGEFRSMQENGIMEPSTSEWAALIVLVGKKDGSLRFCVDYRKLNDVSDADAYPMPRIDELIDRLGKARYICTLDLTRGYWQVPVAEESRGKTAFTTPYWLYQFRVMPFGLHGAPASFQRMMDRLLNGAYSYAAAYLDDLVIYSETWGEHKKHLRDILERLRAAGVTAKPPKCQFAMAERTYLGHIVGNGKIQPEPDKIRAVETFPQPVTKKHAGEGISGYYRKFIPDYATGALPLTGLTRKNAPTDVTWSEQCTRAFAELKWRLCTIPVLSSPDCERQFTLQTDASERGVGAVLSQHSEDGEEHPVVFFSRTLLPREERYSTVEKECLAIKLAVHAFRVYLLGKPFIVQSDLRPLEWLHRMKENNARLTRWSLALQPYQFKVKHRAGKDNENADGLSRSATN